MTKKEESEYQRAYRQAHKAESEEYQKAYYQANRERIKKRTKAYYEANKEYARERQKAYVELHAEQTKAAHKAYYERNKVKIAAQASAYKKANRDKINASVRKLFREKPHAQIANRIRSNICQSVRNQSPSGKAFKTEALLGCTVQAFKAHIESRFKPGMTWDNIHLDHIIPCSHFDLTNPMDQKRCFRFTNYRPLFANDNCKRRDVMTLADWAMLT